MNRARRAAVLLAATGAVLAVLAGCGGPADAPRDAAVADFCAVWDELAVAESGEDVQRFAAGLEEVGTPAEIPADARDGFVVVVEAASAVDADDSLEDLTDDDVSAGELEDAEAFFGYARDTCGRPRGEAP